MARRKLHLTTWLKALAFVLLLSFPAELLAKESRSRDVRRYRRGSRSSGRSSSSKSSTSNYNKVVIPTQLDAPPLGEAIQDNRCRLMPRIIEPKEKAYLRNSCSSKHQDDPALGILLWRPSKSSQMSTLKKAFPHAEFVVIFDGPSSSANYKEWRKALDGPNDFIIYTKAEFKEVEGFERLMKFTSARHAVYLNNKFTITTKSVTWLKQMYKRLANVGGGVFAASQGGSEWSEDENGEDLYGPYIVDRHNIYTKGGVGTHRWCFSNCGIALGLTNAAARAGLKTYTEGTPFSFEDGSGSCISASTSICDTALECSTGYDGKPVTTSLAIQFFKRDHMVQQLVTRLKKFDAEILINNDGNTAHNSFMRWTDKRFHIIHAPNIHEIRGYTRLGHYARGDYLVLLQDDDKPKNANWLKNFFKIFASFPNIGMIGGHRGRLDVGKQFDKTTGQNKGDKYGTPSAKGHKFKDIKTKDPKSNQLMMFIYKANAAPLVLKRDILLELGGLNKNLSCPGDPGIGFDFEYSIRLWYNNYQVALAPSEFLRSHSAKGTRANSKIWNIRRRTEIRNNKYFYTMFKNFHHKKGTQLALDANKHLVKA